MSKDWATDPLPWHWLGVALYEEYSQAILGTYLQILLVISLNDNTDHDNTKTTCLTFRLLLLLSIVLEMVTKNASGRYSGKTGKRALLLQYIMFVVFVALKLTFSSLHWCRCENSFSLEAAVIIIWIQSGLSIIYMIVALSYTRSLSDDKLSEFLFLYRNTRRMIGNFSHFQPLNFDELQFKDNKSR